jgi:hypothetical protein
VTNVSAEGIADYLNQYVYQYRQAYERLTGPPPHGSGYPERASISPYLDDSPMECLLGTDGWAIVDYAGEPRNASWHVAGGPAMMIDYEPTAVPDRIPRILSDEGILGKDIGIYRIVSPDKLPIEVWTGSFPLPSRTVTATCSDKPLVVKQYDLTIAEIQARLTFGVTTRIDLLLPSDDDQFWLTRKVRNLGFTTADRAHSRFFRYLEVGRHLNAAAWDSRSTAARVGMDLRWDYGSDLDAGGSITLVGPSTPLIPAEKVLTSLGASIIGLQHLLDQEETSNEDVYHDYLFNHCILLDVYGRVQSKPKFYYPAGDTPIGKAYVEPDFIVAYPDQTYRLVELERPGKLFDTAHGETRAALTQAAFQIGEWRDYIARFPARLADQFPGLVAGNYRTTIVIGRNGNIRAGRDTVRYLSVVRQQIAVDEVLTYDGLLARAEVAYAQLAALAV